MTPSAISISWRRHVANPPILIFTEVLRDLDNGGDVMELVDVGGHAARAESADAGVKLPGKFAEPMSRMRGDASKDIGQPSSRIDAVICLEYSETPEFHKGWIDGSDMLASRDTGLMLFRVEQFGGDALGVLRDIDDKPH